MARLTKAERDEQAANDRRARAIAEFRTSFLRDRNRKVYDERMFLDAMPEADRVVASTLYNFVSDFKRAEEKLLQELRATERDVHEAIERVAVGREPFWSSNGLTGRHGVDIDEQAVRLDVLRKAIDRFARATGWRVREIEDAAAREFGDTWQAVDVAAVGVTSYGIRRVVDGLTTWFDASRVGAFETTPSRAELFGAASAATVYDCESAAWAALGALVTGRAL